jgi:hypothetical protein
MSNVKYLFPWQKAISSNFSDEVYIRKIFGKKGLFYVYEGGGSWYNDYTYSKFSHGISLYAYRVMEICMKDMDEWLLENGYSFIEEKDVERFREKLSVLL